VLNNPREKKIQLDQAVQTFDQLDKGFIPGFGAAQIDTFPQEDNVDATHPLNVDYFLPGNFQRLLGARLSFRLRAYRAYVSAATSSGSSFVTDISTSTTVAVTGWSDISVVNSISTSVCVAGCNGTCHTGGVGTTSVSHITQTQAGIVVGVFRNFATAVTSVGLSYGVVESTVAAGVTVKIDGTDVTALLTPAGPYNADQLEIDLRPVMTAARISTGAFHTIQLTPTGLGRIHAFLRLTYFVNGQIA
jgi:hypothetical protein